MDEAVVAHLSMAADHHVGMHDGAGADPGAGGDDGERPDRHTFSKRDALFDVSEPVHAGCGAPRIREQFDSARKREIRLIGTQHRAGCRLGLVTKDHRRGACRAKLPDIAWVAEESEVASLCVLDAGDATNVGLSIAFDATAKTFSNVFEEQRPKLYGIRRTG
jgi:hypothetical protein